MRDLILSVRADESIHRDINHRFAELPKDANVEREVEEFFEKDSRIRKEIKDNQNPKIGLI